MHTHTHTRHQSAGRLPRTIYTVFFIIIHYYVFGPQSAGIDHTSGQRPATSHRKLRILFGNRNTCQSTSSVICIGLCKSHCCWLRLVRTMVDHKFCFGKKPNTPKFSINFSFSKLEGISCQLCSYSQVCLIFGM